MAIYFLKRVQRLPVSIEEAWDFFSSPENLKTITPGYMRFEVTSSEVMTNKIYPGQIITYSVRPVLGIPLFWMTEITQAVPGQYFIDEQRVGPYRIWHHQHHFKAIESGVEMTDLLHYQLPFGIFGTLAYHLFVRRQIESIFDFRQQKLALLFPPTV